jgi:hypothetical protein
MTLPLASFTSASTALSRSSNSPLQEFETQQQQQQQQQHHQQ